ncbi:MAG: DUF2442 domain-containing protein [Chthoniobacteraceae bacterium]|jgi:hypothetical protein
MKPNYLLEEVAAIRPLDGYRVAVTFADGYAGEVDLAVLLDCGGEIFQPWHEPELFRQVTVNDFGAPEWPGEIDLSPGSLRAWCEAGRFMDYDETDQWIAQHSGTPEKAA